MKYTKRFLWHNGPHFNYRIKWMSYENPNDGNKYWECEEVWFIGIQVEPRLFERCNSVYYDGHTVKYCTILGVKFISGYSWQAERII